MHIGLRGRDMKKILFINPSLRLNSPTKFLPVGIASVMTYLDHHSIDFDFLDIDINEAKSLISKNGSVRKSIENNK